MLKPVLDELTQRIRPYLQKMKTWHLVVLALFLALVSMIYLQPGGVSGTVRQYVDAIILTPRVLFGGDQIPMTAEQRALLQRHVNRLTSQLRAAYENRAVSPYMNAWAIAQVGIAINDKSLLMSESFVPAIVETKDRTTGAWKESEEAGYHIPSTSWSLIALTKAGASAEDTVGYLVRTQRRSDGAWSVYEVSDARENASTYATAWTVMALSTWADTSNGSPELKNSARAASARGLDWLSSRHAPGTWIWSDYPQYPAEGTPSISVTGLVIHVLAKSQSAQSGYEFKDIAAVSTAGLPEIAYTPWAKEVSGAVLIAEKSSIKPKDTVRYYILPWTLVQIVDSYKDAGFRGRVASIQFVDQVLKKLEEYSVQMSAESRPWIAAEYLISLRYLMGERTI